MDMCKFVIILILYFSSSSCYPAKPLNERSPELTWEAWLLVDEQQNQNKQPSDGVLRRRITPKSVFIAPTFSPESLPACAEGYSSDHLGRCIKIIKLDQAAHYDFLIEKLKEKFSPADYDDDYYDDPAPTPGPFQVNIPLGIQSDDDLDDGIEESDVAIIVSPTKPQNYYGKNSLGKRESLGDEAEQELLLKKLVESTTPETVTETTTEPVDTTTITTTTKIDTTTTTFGDTTTNTDPTTETETTSSPKYNNFFDPATSESNIIRFPMEPKVQTLQSRFRFPSNEDVTPSQIPSSFNHMPRAIGVAQAREPVEPEISFDLINFRDSHATVAPQETSNRRNRDKNNGLFMLPPRWSDDNYQRPVVLRFSRKHAYLDMEQFKKPNYYRSIPTDDFAYLFKFKHKQSNRR